MPYGGSPRESEEGGGCRSLTHSLTQSPPGHAPAASPSRLRTSSSSCVRPAQLLPCEGGGCCGPRDAPTRASPQHTAADGIGLQKPQISPMESEARTAASAAAPSRQPERRGRKSKQARQFLLMSLLKIPATKRSNCK